LLTHVCEQVSGLTGCNGAGILLIEDDRLRLVASRAAPANVGTRYPIDNDHPTIEVIRHRQPIVIRDVRGDDPLARRYRETAGLDLETTLTHIRSWLSVPLVVRDRVIGVLGASHPEPDYFTPHHTDLVSAIASQAAIAIENARLLEESRTLAAVEERQRLARELHDSAGR
jgi:GAF domain-containing protein